MLKPQTTETLVPAHRPLTPTLLATLLLLCACDSGGAPPKSATQPAAPTSLAQQAARWSRADALARMTDEALALHAAARLVQLAEIQPLCLPGPPSDQDLRQRRLARLTDTTWALGLADAEDDTRIFAPVLLAANGDISTLDDHLGEETLVLHLAENAQVFPHLVVQPERVRVVTDDVNPAMVLATREHVRFALRQQHGFSYIALVLLADPAAEEVARYRWDPFEEAFLGPAVDALPDPPGGKFELDLEASPMLVPVGGEIPAPEPLEQPPPDKQPRYDAGDEFA